MELLSASENDRFYRALKSKDARFDGLIFVGVRSTGIYCRPICPARSAQRKNVCFFLSAAAAQAAGFRPCLRCRPETAPQTGSWRGTSNTVSRGLALIADGALDGDEASVDTLAERLGVGERQLRRLFDQHLGASPLAVAQTRRILFAKQLIHDTELPMAEIAFASGFGSIRRFNETFQQLFQRPPSALRRKRRATTVGVTVELRYRPPYDWAALIAWLQARAIHGVEVVHHDCYHRTIQLAEQCGTLTITHAKGKPQLVATIRLPTINLLQSVVNRIRRVFDLAADVTAIGQHLAKDPLLAPLVAARPGLRVPGGWDGFELAARAILGQQVTVEAGRKLLNRLVELCGSSLVDSQDQATAELGLTKLFPTASQIVAADLTRMPMPASRQQALIAMAKAALADPQLFVALPSVEETVAKLQAIPGVGAWTAHYIALRAVREPDAFPASDVGLLRAAVDPAGIRPLPSALLSRAERWRPWRAYAAQHLWTASGAHHD